MAAIHMAAAPVRRGRIWLAIGVALLIYAVLGNYFVLPGYRRFLEHGSPNPGEQGIDIALIWGAARTILWMLSFHFGVFCLAVGALAAQGNAARTFRRWFVVGALIWIALWAIPKVPGPFTEFFAGIGVVIACMIVIVFAAAGVNALRPRPIVGTIDGGRWLIASVFFFALATWDMCGLGSVGGILHPADGVRAASQSLVVAQTTKLIVEMAFAWALLAVATFPSRSA
jgi:hypothetical protein